MSTTAATTTKPAHRPLTREEVKVGDFLVLPYNGRETITGLKNDWYLGQVVAVGEDGFTIWPLGMSTVGLDEGKPTARYREPFGPISWELLSEKYGRQYIRRLDAEADHALLAKHKAWLASDVVSLKKQLWQAEQLFSAIHKL